jgi:stearoyl-CoA desaturase (delta-9 desaturase)
VSLRTTISSRRLRRVKRTFVSSINFVSFAGCLVAAFQIATSKVGVQDVVLLALMYALTAIGVSVGFHRYFAHRSFKTTPMLRAVLAVLGSMAAVGSITSWVSTHRCHHRHSDAADDPHSPNLAAPGWLGKARGLWHGHMGWLFNDRLPNSLVFAKDLLRDPMVSRINRTYVLWVLAGLALPAALGGALQGTWSGALQGLIWGGLVRVFLGFHAACSINSICHAFGRRPFVTRELSGNVAALAIPTFGESWHNNHHAFPRSARFGLEWWQLDIGYLVIRAMAGLRLASDVRTSPRLPGATEKIVGPFSGRPVARGGRAKTATSRGVS